MRRGWHFNKYKEKSSARGMLSVIEPDPHRSNGWLDGPQAADNEQLQEVGEDKGTSG
jgi:hypothetical protein